MAYALVRGPERRGAMNGAGIDFEAVDEAKRTVGGDFLWFRKGDKAYLIQDAAVLARLAEAYVPVNRLGAQMEVYGKQMDQYGKVMESLGKDMEKVANGIKLDEAEVRKSEHRAAMDALNKQMNEAGKPMDALGKKMDVLGKQLDREARAADKATQEAIREAMGKGLARPMKGS